MNLYRSYSLKFASLSAVSVTVILTQSKKICAEKQPKAEVPVIYRYKICPFCHRTEAYLDFLQINYKAIEVNPLTKSEIKFSPDHKKVPIAIIGGETILDSNNIIDYITQNLVNDSFRGLSREKFITKDSAIWNEWSEKKLAVMLYPNITRSFAESWECFGYASNVASWNGLEQGLVRIVGSIAMFFVNNKIKKKYGIVHEREELHALLLEWTTALGDKIYLHGEQPSLPDVLVYGVLGAIGDTATFREIMAENTKLNIWFKNMDHLITSPDSN